MKYLFILFFSSCSTINCFDLYYDEVNKLTYLENASYTGDCKSYFFTGNLKSEQSYINGKDHGDWIFYFSNGNIQTMGTFENGIKVGKWQYYHENGKIFKENFYSDIGTKIGLWKTYDKNGILIKEEKIIGFDN